MVKRFGAGFVCGYLLGARTGRERYEQLAEAARKFMDFPMVRDVVGSVEDRARDVAHRLTDVVEDAVHGTGDSDVDRDKTERGRHDGVRDTDGEAGDEYDGEPEDVDGSTRETVGPGRQAPPRGRSRRRGGEDGERPRPRPGTQRNPQRRPARAGAERRSARAAEGGRDRTSRAEEPRAKGSRAGRSRPEKAGRSGLARAAASALERGRTD